MPIAPEFLSIAAVGFAAQLADGSLGMGFGTVATAYLTGTGLTPAVAGAAAASIGLGAGSVSAAAHARFRNVHWPTAIRLGTAGLAGGFAGAWALATLAGLDAATPVASALLILVGLVLARRGFTGRTDRGPVRTGFALPAGLVGGFAGAACGGWGPVAVPVVLATSRLEPRRAVGSAAAAQVLACAGAVCGFWLASPSDLTIITPIGVGIALGAVVAAPFAAWLTGRLPSAKLTATIGMLAVALHLRTLLSQAALPWPAATAAYLLLAALWAIALTGRRPRSAPQTPTPEREREPARAEA